ncbi:hypothetical protein DH2020_004763 [Rehmannia glutinosa]|uniref:Agenet domain-containing protein n=1 Tax=Rehmannia glutinosa TaxID=99300 RepID=A0ABR0XQD5_REHGL
MENEINLPFKVGELAEARSFEKGYRGAWFRCKITEITMRKGSVKLEYYDYPDEKTKSMRLYQVPPYYIRKKDKYRELMLRPAYPPIYNVKQMPHASVISEVSVIVDDSWKVGDMVDWWTSDCYWCGRITQLLGDGKAQIELKQPPHGEGSTYDEVYFKDLRPSLDWSPEYGWTIPTQETDKHVNIVFRKLQYLIYIGANAAFRFLTKPCADIGAIADAGGLQIMDKVTAGPSVGLSLSSPPPVSSDSAFSDEVKSTGTTEMPKRSLGSMAPKKPKDIQDENTSQGCTRKTSRADTDSGHTSAERPAEISEEDLKKYRGNGGVTLNSVRSDTLEAAVLDLEEYLNKVKWLKTILGHGISSSDAPRPQWEFLEPHAASDAPK